MTLEEIITQLISNGMSEQEARKKAEEMINSMNSETKAVVSDIKKELDNAQSHYNSKLVENQKNGSIYDAELENMKNKIHALQNELNQQVGIQEAIKESEEKMSKIRAIETYQNQLKTMTPNSPMYNATVNSINALKEELGIDPEIDGNHVNLANINESSDEELEEKLKNSKHSKQAIEQKQLEEEKKSLMTKITNYQNDLQTMEPGSPNYKATENAIARLTKELEQLNAQPTDIVLASESLEDNAKEKRASEVFDKHRKKINEFLSNARANLKASKQQAIVPANAQSTDIQAIPPTAQAYDEGLAKESLIEKFKNFSPKKKIAVIVGAVVLAGVVVAGLANALLNGDTTTLQQSSQMASDSSFIQGIAKTAQAGSDFINQVGSSFSDAINNIVTTPNLDSNPDNISQIVENIDLSKGATDAYNAVAGTNTVPLNVEGAQPVAAFDTVNNSFLSLDQLQNLTPEQLDSTSILTGNQELADKLQGVTDPNVINDIINNNIPDTVGYVDIPNTPQGKVM